MHDDGWLLTQNSTLCHWNPEYYFIQWEKAGRGWVSYNVPEGAGGLSNNFVKDVMTNTQRRNLALEKVYAEGRIEQQRVLREREEVSVANSLDGCGHSGHGTWAYIQSTVALCPPSSQPTGVVPKPIE
jgi:hypothetical protein